jgi:hypothetical protein
MITNDIMISINRSSQIIDTSFKIQKTRPIWRIRIQKIKKIWGIGKQ